ncbi:MAG: hypothetical protein IT487_12295 [Chromatiaceae bacterium]|nr:hypothetical protein [Chromatiaceae bacterium]
MSLIKRFLEAQGFFDTEDADEEFSHYPVEPEANLTDTPWLTGHTPYPSQDFLLNQLDLHTPNDTEVPF